MNYIVRQLRHRAGNRLSREPYTIADKKLDLAAADRIALLEELLTQITAANANFREGMPKDWEGDPLQDACGIAARALKIPSMGDVAKAALEHGWPTSFGDDPSKPPVIK